MQGVVLEDMCTMWWVADMCWGMLDKMPHEDNKVITHTQIFDICWGHIDVDVVSLNY